MFYKLIDYKPLIQYIRDVNKKPIGVVVAVDRNKIGWSLCHKDDKWDREKALKIAIGRAWSIDCSDTLVKIPYRHFDNVSHIITKMLNRASIYYKQ